ncbi:hypothetical protein [Povalibacter sp.]|uniref:hypothetical protein n=1 Tax=Povalibacter sp. TaxID=1962978 RepID=UPI002F409D2E
MATAHQCGAVLSLASAEHRIRFNERWVIVTGTGKHSAVIEWLIVQNDPGWTGGLFQA